MPRAGERERERKLESERERDREIEREAPVCRAVHPPIGNVSRV